MNDEHTEKVTTEETTVKPPETETVKREETTVEKPVLNDPADLAEMSPGAPQAVEKETTVTETRESNDS